MSVVAKSLTVFGAEIPLVFDDGQVTRWRGRAPESRMLIIVHRFVPNERQLALGRNNRWKIQTRFVAGRNEPRRRFRYELEVWGATFQEAERNAHDARSWLVEELAGGRW